VSVAIEAMTARDYDDVLALWRASPGVGLSDSDTREGVTRFLDANPGLSLVAREDGRLIGAVLCGHDGRRGYITHLAVDRRARRRGLGRALVERCRAALRRERIEKCHVFVFADNGDAISFWTAIEWGERPDLAVLSRFTTDETPDP
jgi:putative acetyltransferase